MRHFFIILLLFVPFICFGQDVQVIAATIVNNETQEPVESVNIGFVGKGIGTVSNALGNFSLVFKKSVVKPSDILQISSIGYESKELKAKDLNALTSYKVTISLTPKNYDLEQVIVKGIPREKKILGHPNVTAFNMGYWRNAEALGGEIASAIRVRKKNTRILNLKFNVIENMSDSIKVRVNVYDFKRGVPGKNLLTQNIFHTITRKKGLETIDLKPYRISVNDDIAVSIELIEIYGTAIYFAISASAYGGQSFTRGISQDHWKIYKEVGIGFSLESSYPAKGSDKEIKTRPKPEAITLLWDTSLNLQNRNKKEELKLLKKYISSLDNVEVKVSKFDNKIYESKTFPCFKGRCNELFTYLEDSQYHGASNYAPLLQENNDKAASVLVFSDGNSFYGALDSKIEVPTFVINSIQKADHKELQDLSINSGAAYIDLTRLSQKTALYFLTYDISDMATYEAKETAIDDYYYGVVYRNDSIPVDGATIRVQNQLEEVVTKSNGSYKIEAKAGDILEIEALGMYDEKVELGSFRKVHIPMKVNRELLQEVLIENRKEEKPLVVTPFGKRNPDAIGFSMEQTITSEDINPSFTDLGQVLNWGRGIDAVRLDDFGTTKYRFRKFKYASILLTTYAAVVVDDIVYDQNIPGTRVPVVNPQQIERILLLSTALSTVKYGRAAAYGAIVIETKGYTKNHLQEEEEEIEASALAKGNEYNENVMTLEQATTSLKNPDYLGQLEASTSFEVAKNQYFKALKQHKNSVSFHILAANYFEKWDSDFAEAVRSNILSIAPTNTKALKVLAYQLEKFEQYKEAQAIYEQILELDPDSAQSYRDLAQMYVLNENYADAASLYKQMIYNTIPHVDFIQFQDILLTEFQHLIKNHKSQIDFTGLPNEMLSLDFKRDIRLVLEWSTPGTEFDVQFVNPENKFYNFSHTYFNNKELLKQELDDGISMKEFIIDDDTKGRWLVNIKYEGIDEKKIPVVLKYTLYQNYELPEETKTIKTVQLDQFQNKVTLDSFLNSGN
ncbi:MAG: carboxypeptidase-like regulatory domain-containing protein [Bacteroidota bacterium]